MIFGKGLSSPIVASGIIAGMPMTSKRSSGSITRSYNINQILFPRVNAGTDDETSPSELFWDTSIKRGTGSGKSLWMSMLFKVCSLPYLIASNAAASYCLKRSLALRGRRSRCCQRTPRKSR